MWIFSVVRDPRKVVAVAETGYQRCSEIEASFATLTCRHALSLNLVLPTTLLLH